MSTNYVPKFSDADTVVDSSIQDNGSQVIVGNPILSPALTGTPTAPTATAGTNTTQVATTAFVTTAVAAEVTARETLESELTAESSARVAEDTNLQANIDAEASARAIADTAQSFTGSTGTNPYSASTPLTPRFLGDKAYNITSQEWWHGIATNGSTSSWIPTLSGSAYAPLDSPALTGTPTAPTATAGTNTTQVATTAFVTTAVSAVGGGDTITLSGDVNGSGTTSISTTLTTSGVSAGTYGSATTVPSITVDTKGRITSASSTAIQLPESQVTNLTTYLAAKAPLASPALTGTPTAPTASTGTNTTQVATTAFVAATVASYAPSITPINAQTGTTYTLVASDAGKIVTFTNSSAITVVVPASIFSAGQSIIIGQSGTGQVTMSAGSGMTLHTTSTLKTKSQYSRIAVMFDSSSAATIVGERAAS